MELCSGCAAAGPGHGGRGWIPACPVPVRLHDAAHPILLSRDVGQVLCDTGCWWTQVLIAPHLNRDQAVLKGHLLMFTVYRPPSARCGACDVFAAECKSMHAVVSPYHCIWAERADL